MMNVNKILVIRYSGLGDIVMLLQTLKKLKEKYNNSTITLLTDHSNSAILKNTCGVIDEIIPINRKVFKEKKIIALLKELQSLFFNVRKKQYDLLIDFQNFGETATISYLAKATEKIGAPKKEKYYYGYTKIVQRDESGHRSQFFSRIAEVSDNLDFSKLCLESNGEKYKNSLLKRLDKNKKIIGLNIGSTQDSRRWSEQNFYKLAKELEEKYNILVFIGPAEKKFESTFKDLYVVKDTSLNQLCGAISICDYFVTNDTGPAHIAAGFGVPTLTFFEIAIDENTGALIDKKLFIKNTKINEISVKEAKDKLLQLTNI
ncbi:glycosyltransferase family 9 protein [Sulfurospirillum arcachonense]|uniref:glycosyltransferase family 9 protein n=1 Tax=Sulfurospirillum arcachonense TaxID=57666 RepID=UPI00055A8C39|nr:glycosyltransferase family 9 protein [Sulfurospirillum arcachonense]